MYKEMSCEKDDGNGWMEVDGARHMQRKNVSQRKLYSRR